MKFATKLIRQYPSHLRHVATLPWEIKNSNFLCIFSRYGRKCKQIAFRVHRWIPVSRDISWTVLWVCDLSSWLKIKSLTVSTFSSVRALRGLPLHGRLAIVPVSRNFFNSFVQLFSGNSSVNLFAVYPFKQKLCQNLVVIDSPLNTMLTVDKHCSDVCCDEFPVPHIGRKSKQVREQWYGKFYLQSVWGKTRYYKHRKYQICGWIRKLETIKMQFVCVFFHICRKFEFLISQGSVATRLRWSG